MEWSHTKLNGLSKFNGSNNINNDDDDWTKLKLEGYHISTYKKKNIER